MEIIVQIFSDQNFIGAILSTIVFLFLGFFFRRKNIIGEKGKEVINALVMKIAIPCMAFAAFMSDFDPNELSTHGLLLLLSLLLYVIFILFGNLVFIKSDNSKRPVYAILAAVGQLTFFSIPILKAIYSGEHLSSVLIPSSLMTLSFRIVVYIYCFITISGTKLTKENAKSTLKSIFVNPIMISMGLGVLIWLIQNVIWQVDVNGTSYGFLRIDKTCPALFKIISMGDSLATPLCMLLIGVTLGESNIASALKNKTSWLIASLKMFAIPAITFGICILIQLTGLIRFNEYSLAAIVIGMDAPTSAVVIAFCNDYDRETYVASDSVFLSTLLSIISIPIFFILIKFAITWPLFA
ncbi:MAG: AEC family transporter [Mollicutes bacterium]|nr:AEC family transporter [Mollicutes bacterium]MDD7714805.1 AEC family transporter [Mollicutes bacterium]MDY3904705.1 AEC family transporter [Candidatus Enteromonas sp.]MDY4935695.1 AEC family transporter [Candidatus Enteromonas sp.]